MKCATNAVIKNKHYFTFSFPKSKFIHLAKSKKEALNFCASTSTTSLWAVLYLLCQQKNFFWGKNFTYVIWVKNIEVVF